MRKNNHPAPISIALVCTTRCNSKCKTCEIWRQPHQELSLEQIKKLLCEIGHRPIWFTISGGEPFLRDDLVEIVKSILHYCSPKFLNIASNGILTERFRKQIPLIVDLCKKNKVLLSINLSIDEIDDRYGEIRAVNGYSDVKATREYLRTFDIRVGVNITVSKYNVERFKEIFYEVQKTIAPDLIMSEMATNRSTFFLTEREDLSPAYEQYSKCVDFLLEQELKRKSLFNWFISRLRKRYYKETLKEGFKTHKCSALVSSAEIMPSGDVVSCCEKGYVIGNITQNSFHEVWGSGKAHKYRKQIKSGCYCSAVSPYYTSRYSFLRHFPIFFKKVLSWF